MYVGSAKEVVGKQGWMVVGVRDIKIVQPGADALKKVRASEDARRTVQ